MSDPVTNADIEDVLSSIRRLVSENASPETAERVSPVQAAPKRELDRDTGGVMGATPEAGTAKAASADSSVSDKLVLTPAFRVHEPDIDPQPDPAEDVAFAQETAPFTAQTVQEIASEIAAEAAETLPASGDEAVQAPSDEVMFLHQPINRPAAEPEQALDAVAPDSAPELPTAEQGIEVADETASVDAQPVEMPAEPAEETLEDAAMVEGAPDTLSEAKDTMTDQANDTLPSRVEIEVDVQVAEDFDWPPTEQAAETSLENAQDDPALEHRVAELEAAVNDSAVEFEPDLGDAVEDLGPGIFLRHRADQEGDAATSSAPERGETAQNWEEFDAEVAAFMDDDKEIEGHAKPTEGGAEAPILEAEDDADLIDEEVLRELVVRLVREELQGAVGEKITRNVRRLVRREVERALTLKSLE